MFSRLRRTVHKILWNILLYFEYRIAHIQELLRADLPVRNSFALEFLSLIEENNDWYLNILWAVKAHF